MLGLIFTEALDFIEEQVGLVGLEEIMAKADLPDGAAFTAVGNYDHEQLVTVVLAASKISGTPAEELMRAFGSWMFPRLVEAHEHAQKLAQKGLSGFLLGLQSQIHDTLEPLYDAPHPPSVLAEERGGTIVVEYRSHRPVHWRRWLRACLKVAVSTLEARIKSACDRPPHLTAGRRLLR